MKYSLRSSFSRYTLALFISILFVTALGLAVSVTGAWAYCNGWPVCIPSTPPATAPGATPGAVAADGAYKP